MISASLNIFLQLGCTIISTSAPRKPNTAKNAKVGAVLSYKVIESFVPVSHSVKHHYLIFSIFHTTHNNHVAIKPSNIQQFNFNFMGVFRVKT